MTELAHDSTDYSVVEEEDPAVLSRNLVTSGRLFASATVFFFVTFFFAYFYLRSVNNGGMWKPKHVDASVTWGSIVTACIVASAILVRLGLADHRAGNRTAWRRKGAAALVLGIASLVIQGIGWTQQGFGPSEGGYASVYYGWTAFVWLFVLCTMFWLETTLATSLRYRKIPSGAPAPGEASGDPDRMAHDVRDPLSLVRAELVALSGYWTFLAGIAVVTWIVLYLI